jgi:hypothetical protein
MLNFAQRLTLAPLLAGLSAAAFACPFCPGDTKTLTEELAAADVVLVARLTRTPPPPTSEDEPIGVSTFAVLEIVKGAEHVKGRKTLEIVLVKPAEVGGTFLVLGLDPTNLLWSTPLPFSERARNYLTEIRDLKVEGAARLAFFQDYLEHRDPVLAGDAFNEFARAPYDVVKALGPEMRREQLLAWIRDGELPATRRRLYLTMLGVCGTAADLPLLEKLMRSDDRDDKSGLDAMVACYLTLRGPEGMPLVEELFLANRDAEFSDIYSAIMALRFHGDEETIVPRQRLLAGLRPILERPDLADLVIPDFARWKDWSVMERLVRLFKESDEKTSWVRVPVINYLTVCPLMKAKDYIAELEEIDPQAVRRARVFAPMPPDS